MKKLIGRFVSGLLLTGFLFACNGGRNAQSWQPKKHRKSSVKAPPAYQKRAY
ncbi:MAG: hypothetical protein H7Z75_03535 [Ferruginibacter sp.]|nr:hypothetical protein [Cytophagales bacterium]